MVRARVRPVPEPPEPLVRARVVPVSPAVQPAADASYDEDDDGQSSALSRFMTPGSRPAPLTEPSRDDAAPAVAAEPAPAPRVGAEAETGPAPQSAVQPIAEPVANLRETEPLVSAGTEAESPVDLAVAPVYDAARTGEASTNDADEADATAAPTSADGVLVEAEPAESQLVEPAPVEPEAVQSAEPAPVEPESVQLAEPELVESAEPESVELVEPEPATTERAATEVVSTEMAEAEVGDSATGAGMSVAAVAAEAADVATTPVMPAPMQLQPESELDPVDHVLKALIHRAKVKQVGIAEVAAELVEQANLEERDIDEVLADLVDRVDDDETVDPSERLEELTLFNNSVPRRPGQLTDFERLDKAHKKRVIIRVLCLLVAMQEDNRLTPSEPRSEAETRHWPLARAVWPVAALEKAEQEREAKGEADPSLPDRRLITKR